MSGIIRRVLFFAAVALAAPAVRAGDVPAAGDPPRPDARFYLATRTVPDYVERGARGDALWSAVQSFYRARDYRLVWVTAGHVSAEAEAVARIVERAEGEGLDGARYRWEPVGPRAVTPAFNGAPASDADAVQDVQLTYVFLRYAADLSGRFDPKTAGPFWLTRPPPRDVAPWLEQSLRSGRIVAAFAALSPPHTAYGALKAALASYREIARKGGWAALPPRLVLRRGSRGPQVAAVRTRLAVEGDLSSATASGLTDAYDSSLAEGVKRFEQRHGLVADGVLDAVTVAALNVPVEERLRQIELNLERWRWLPADLGRRYVMVNVPSFQLSAHEDGRPAVAMKVVTGKPDSPTPVFTGDGQTLFFESLASDMITQDINQNSDLFSLNLYATNSVDTGSPLLVRISSFATNGTGPFLSWRAAAGKFYRVQFKNNLSDPWQDFNGNVAIVGGTGYATEVAPVPRQRFYRMIMF